MSHEDAPSRRLTLRGIARDAMHRFFNFERGWLRTARELLTQPGAMVRRYVEGDRASYANPFTFLVLCTAFSLLLQTVTGFQDRIVEGMQAGRDMSPGQLEFVNQFSEIMFRNSLYVSATILIPFALLLRWFFRRSGFNLAEILVFVLYTGGEVALLAVVAVVLSLVFSLDPTLFSLLGMLASLVYLAYAAMGFFGRGLGTVVKTVLAYLVSYGTFMLFVMVATLIYLLAFRPAVVGGDDWNLVSAAEENAVQKARQLLEEGANVNLTLGRTPLHVASEKGNAELVDLLMSHGADVNARDHQSRVPMFLALAGGHSEVAWRLAQAGTDATARAADGATLLLMALRAKDERLARWALAGGADVNAVRDDVRRATALIVAAMDLDLEMVELLLENGADPSLTNRDGKTALDLARDEAVKTRLRAAAGPSNDPRAGVNDS